MLDLDLLFGTTLKGEIFGHFQKFYSLAFNSKLPVNSENLKPESRDELRSLFPKCRPKSFLNSDKNCFEVKEFIFKIYHFLTGPLESKLIFFKN